MSLFNPSLPAGSSAAVHAHSKRDWAMHFATSDCGPNLEYDNAFLELQQAALGKPETQFEPATWPDCGAIEEGALQLLGRSRDLRILLLLLEARLNLTGIGCLPEGLNAIALLLENAWPNLNPPLDEGDAYARLNVIESMGFGGSFFQSLRNCIVVQNPRTGELRLKDFEALQMQSSVSSPPYSREQLQRFFNSPESPAADLIRITQESILNLQRILHAVANHVPPELLPQLVEVKALFHHLLACLPFVHTEQSSSGSPLIGQHDSLSAPSLPTGRPTAQLVDHAAFQSIQSRAQALAAIDLVCSYLEQAEPTNPAQLLLKRARRLMDRNFMQLMKELAPEALSDVAKIMGINPDSLGQDDA